jgi:hypothetical protein
MGVIVLATSVESPIQVNFLSPELNTLAGAGCWNFALDDNDRILRVVSNTIQASDVVLLLERFGFSGKELE